MIRILVASTCAMLASLAPAAAQSHRTIGVETAIYLAGNEGVRNWQAGPPRSNVLFLQDRALKWYRVELSGPCFEKYRFETFRYRAGADGKFDRNSRVWSTRAPGQVCGVRSVKTSLAPKGEAGWARPRGWYNQPAGTVRASH